MILSKTLYLLVLSISSLVICVIFLYLAYSYKKLCKAESVKPISKKQNNNRNNV